MTGLVVVLVCALRDFVGISDFSSQQKLIPYDLPAGLSRGSGNLCMQPPPFPTDIE
jgi:hypothetical protein